MVTAAASLLGLLGVSAAIRWSVHRGFRAPHIVESGSPADFGMDFREAWIPAVNGKRLFGWLMPAAAGAPAVVMMHGWGANAETLLPLAAPLRQAGNTVLLVDARSHGRSDMDSFSSMPRFAEDIDSAMDWLAAQPGTDSRRIAVLGHSVGGAAALLAASRRNDVAAVISLSSFDHPERIMRRFLSRVRIPHHPFGWLICRYVERVIGHRFDKIAPVATIAKVRCPVLIGHGAEDELVPPSAAAAIHACGNAGVRMVILDGTDHERPACFNQLGILLAEFLATSAGTEIPVDRTDQSQREKSLASTAGIGPAGAWRGVPR